MSNPMQYKAPAAGIYEVSAVTHTYIANGLEVVRNPRRKFWQFWKDKYITRPSYKVVAEHSGRHLRFLEKNEAVVSTIGITRVSAFDAHTQYTPR